jgi:hypothetical protein
MEICYRGPNRLTVVLWIVSNLYILCPLLEYIKLEWDREGPDFEYSLRNSADQSKTGVVPG